MPIFSYFAMAGSALVGLLFLADAVLPARSPLAISREFHGLSATLRSEPAALPRAPALAPEPDMTSEPVKLANKGAAQAVNVEPVNAHTVRPEPAPRKRKRVPRSREWQDQYAQAQDFGWSWGSNNRRRNDGWQSDSGWSDSRRNDFRRNDPWRNDPWRNDRGWR
jgi:hypothetical protein